MVAEPKSLVATEMLTGCPFLVDETSFFTCGTTTTVTGADAQFEPPAGVQAS